MSEGEFRPLRREMQMVFQDPFGSLNPRLTIFAIVGEALEIHFPAMSRADRRGRVARAAGTGGPAARSTWTATRTNSAAASGSGSASRARWRSSRSFIVCDEPVSALDVSVQAQIVNLLQDLQEQLGLTYLFIAHDLAVVEHISDHVLVMYRGKIVESATAEAIYEDPQHDYTRKLLAAVPRFA